MAFYVRQQNGAKMRHFAAEPLTFAYITQGRTVAWMSACICLSNTDTLMPMAWTRRSTPLWRTYKLRYATGLHLYGTKDTYRFDAFKCDGNHVPLLTIGRRRRTESPQVHIALRDSKVSATHAVIKRQGGRRFVIADMGSTHGTWIDGQRLEPKDRPVLMVGMEIRLGNSMFIAVRDGAIVMAVRHVREYAQRLADALGSHREVERRTGVKRDANRRKAMEYRKAKRALETTP